MNSLGRLAGLRIAVPRTSAQPGALVDALTRHGAEVHDIPLTTLERLDDAPLRSSAHSLAQFNWVLLTAPGSADALAAAVNAAGQAPAMRRMRLAVAGTGTLEAVIGLEWEATVQVTRPPYESILDLLATRGDVEDAHFLYPCTVEPRDPLPDGLRALGAHVDVVPVFRHVRDEGAARTLHNLVRTGDVELVAVMSSMGVDALLDAIPAEETRRVRLACLGSQCARAARTAGFTVAVEAATPAVDSLVSALVASRMAAR